MNGYYVPYVKIKQGLGYAGTLYLKTSRCSGAVDKDCTKRAKDGIIYKSGEVSGMIKQRQTNEAAYRLNIPTLSTGPSWSEVPGSKIAKARQHCFKPLRMVALWYKA